MITYITGKLVFKDPTHVIIETGGIGYHIKISLTTFSAVKDAENCKLHTYLSIKEDAHTLYGFSENSEKKVFMDLISISGVGPNTAIMVLSSLSAGELQQAIVNEDVRTIQGVKGIGAKTAQRIILELKDKFKKDSLTDNIKLPSHSSHNTIRNEALSALITLGIPRSAAEKNIDTIIKRDSNLTLEQLIKQALKMG
ncbi:MAG TPA: Holliday junction branch migration protein RuvA [Cytophagaceae bacterium]|jgi:Holliday junction DNA helicase RuvA